MKIVIIGEGKVGTLLADCLSREGHDVVVVDSDPRVLSESQEQLDIMVVPGNGASLEVQKDAGVADSDVLIATTNADETNLLCCILAKKLGCRHTIARVRNPEYSQQVLFLKDELGLSLSINPELAAAQEIFRIIQFPSFLKRDSFDKGRVELVELMVSEGGKLDGKKIYEVASMLKLRILVCAVERDDKVTIPNGGFQLKAGDRITVTAARSTLSKLIKNLGIDQRKIKDVVIVGCSRIAGYLTDELLRSGVDVKIIDKDHEQCVRFAQRFPNILVLHGDASKQGFLESERVGKADAVITLTGIDEENLIISMYASHIGVSKTVTKIDRNEYAGIFASSDIGSLVCPKELTANEIIRYIRAMSSRSEGSVKALHRIVEGKAEALEFNVTSDTPFTDIPLSRLHLKSNLLICCISRSSQIIIPNGDDVMKVGDTVIIVTTADRTIYDLSDIFEKEAASEK